MSDILRVYEPCQEDIKEFSSLINEILHKHLYSSDKDIPLKLFGIACSSHIPFAMNFGDKPSILGVTFFNKEILEVFYNGYFLFEKAHWGTMEEIQIYLNIVIKFFDEILNQQISFGEPSHNLGGTQWEIIHYNKTIQNEDGKDV